MKLRLSALVVICCLLLPTLAGACQPVEPETNTLKVGVLTYEPNDTFINSLTTQLTASLRLREENIGKKITVNIVSSNGDQDEQNTQIDRLLRQNMDVLVVNLVDRTTASSVIQKCKREDVPIIFFNREPVKEDIDSWNKIYYVGAPAEEPGQLQGQILYDLAVSDFASIDRNGDGRIQYVMLEGETNHQDALLRTESSVKVLTDGGIEMDKVANEAADWKLSNAYSIMSSWLTQFGQRIEVVIANNDDMALGAIQAYESSVYRNNGTLFLGFDGTQVGLQAVRDGKLYGTVINDKVDQAAAIADLAVALAQDESASAISGLGIPNMDGRYVRVPHRKVTADNIQEELDRAGEVR